MTTTNECRRCTNHECGHLYAECGCCAAWAGEPGDLTLAAAAADLSPVWGERR